MAEPDAPTGDDVERAAEVFRLLADPTRIRILLALQDGELSVGRLAEIVQKAPTAVSQHLARLRWARMVQTRQDGTRVHYSLVDEHARHLVTEALHQAQHATPGTPEHHRAAGPGPDASSATAAPPRSSPRR